jgi:hypothetical protein
MNAAALEEALTTLSNTLPAVTQRYRRLLADAGASERAAADFLESTGRLAAACGELFHETGRAVEELEQEAATETALVEPGARALAEAFDPAAACVADGLVAVAHAVDEAEDARRTLQAGLAEAGPAATAAVSEALRALESLDGAIAAGAQELEAAQSDVAAEMETLEIEVESVQSGLVEALSSLSEEVAGLIERARQRMQHLGAELAEARESHLARLADEQARLAQGGEASQEAMRAGLDEQFCQAVDEAASLVTEAVQAFDGAAAQAAQALDEARQDLDQRVGELACAMDPLPASVAAVRQGADQVNLPWTCQGGS